MGCQSTCKNDCQKPAATQHYPLDTIDFFASIPAPLLKGLHEAGCRTASTKGQILFTQDDPADRFYMIENGWVKLFRETLDGDEVILDVLPAGYIFGESTMFGNDSYPYAAEVVEAGELTSYPTATLKQIVSNNPPVALALLQHMAEAGKIKDKEIEHRTIMNAPQRIGCFLLRLCKVKQPTPITLNLPYDKTLIAARLGMQPETFSRALNKLQDDTQVKVKGSTVTIDNLWSLISYTCTACSNVFPCED